MVRSSELAEEYFPPNQEKSWNLLFKEFVHCSTRLIKAIEQDKLTDTWQTNTIDTWKSGKTSQEDATSFSKMMDVMHASSSEILAKNVNFHEQFGIKSILDIGGGSGCYRFVSFSNLAYRLTTKTYFLYNSIVWPSPSTNQA